MSDTHPGVEDELEHALRLGLATAAQLADRFARARQELSRDAQRRSDDEHHRLEARFRAEGASATARLSVVQRPEWWNQASPQQIVSMYELAHQWSNGQPHATNAVDTIARQVQELYGVDVTSPNADVTELRAALARVEVDRATAHDADTAVEKPDFATAVAAVVRADQRDSALGATADETVIRYPGAEAPHTRSRAEREPTELGFTYDTPQRRSARAAHMQDAGLSEESVAVATRADIAHARSAVDAATATPASSRAADGRTASRGIHRSDRSR